MSVLVSFKHPLSPFFVLGPVTFFLTACEGSGNQPSSGESPPTMTDVAPPEPAQDQAPPSRPTSCSTRGTQLAHLQGEMVGEATATSAFLQSRLTEREIREGDVPGATGRARFEFSTQEDFSTAVATEWTTTEAANDFIIRQKLADLEPATRYYYRLNFAELDSPEEISCGPVRSFTTLAGADLERSTRFVVVTGMHYGRGHAGGRADLIENGFKALETISSLSPDFFIGTGDNVYYDHLPAAREPNALRKKWHEQFAQRRFIELFSQVPTYWEKDDHDFRYDDADLSGSGLPSVTDGIRLFREQLPIVELGDDESPTYRTHRVSKDLQTWFLEGRDYRSNNSDPDGSQKTLWGIEQREWLKRTLLESDATFKVLITPTPMVGPDDGHKRDNHANTSGFRHEGDAFFEWAKEHQLKENGLLIICGDRHWQYHSVHPSGIEEFSTGALVDENARTGVAPGNGSDPGGEVRQLYTSQFSTGGFLEVLVGSEQQEKKVTFSFRDEHGELLHEVVKAPNGESL